MLAEGFSEGIKLSAPETDGDSLGPALGCNNGIDLGLSPGSNEGAPETETEGCLDGGPLDIPDTLGDSQRALAGLQRRPWRWLA